MYRVARHPITVLLAVCLAAAFAPEGAEAQLAPCAPPSGNKVTADNCALTISGGTYDTGSADFAAVFVAQGNGVLTVTGPVTLRSGGNNATGGYVQAGGQLQFLAPGSTITTTGNDSKGLHAFDSDSITGTGLTIMTSGEQSYGTLADYGGRIALTSSLAVTSGAEGYGVAVFAGTTDISDSEIRVSGTGSSGLAASETGGAISANNVTISASGSDSFGIAARNHAVITAQNMMVAVSGDNSYGVFANTNATVALAGGTVTASGRDSFGLFALSAGISASGLAVTTSGIDTPAAVADGGALTITDSALTAEGADAHAIVLSDGGTAALTGTIVSARGADASALKISASAALPITVSLSGGALTSSSAPAIMVDQGTSFLDMRNLSASGPSWLVADSSLAGGDRVVVVASAVASRFSGSVSTGPDDSIALTLAQGSRWTVTGNSRVTGITSANSAIVFSPPGTDGYKTLTVNNYLGVNATLGFNAFLGGDGSPSDVLAIDGGRTSGRTTMNVANTGGMGAITSGNGILVVSAVNGGTTAPGAFLAAPVLAGPYEYTLFRGSIDGSAPDNWYLRSTTAPAPPGPGPQPQPRPVPNYRREVSLLTALPAMGLLYDRALLTGLHDRIGRGETGGKIGWARIIGGHGSREGGADGVLGSGGPAFSYDIAALQAGFDLFGREASAGDRDRIGFYAAAGSVSGDVRHFDGRRAGHNSIDGYSIGAYWTHIGASGWYTDLVVQATAFDAAAASTRLPALKRDASGWAASLEGGYPFDLGGGWSLEPQAQAIYQSASGGSRSDGIALVRFSDVDAFIGRAGIRLKKGWADNATGEPWLFTWVTANVWRDFSGSPKTSFSAATGAIPFRADLRGSWAEVKIGAEGRLTDTISIYASAGYQAGFDARQRGYDGRLGLKVSW